MVEAAKGLRDFAKANPFLVIKGGVLDGKAMTPREITKLADLEPREVLLAKLAGAMKATRPGRGRVRRAARPDGTARRGTARPRRGGARAAARSRSRRGRGRTADEHRGGAPAAEGSRRRSSRAAGESARGQQH